MVSPLGRSALWLADFTDRDFTHGRGGCGHRPGLGGSHDKPGGTCGAAGHVHGHLGLGGAAVPGRLRLSFGIDVRVFTFRFWDESYRVSLTATANVADSYGNGGLSPGFWH